jgi:nucleoside-diphosphate-sugar epimerase
MVKALVVGGVGVTGTIIVEELLRRDYDVTVLHRGVHEADLSRRVKHIHADPHWREDLQPALEGQTYDLVVGVYGRLRFVAETLLGRTPRMISIGGAMAVYKGWMPITAENPWDRMEDSPLFVREDNPLARLPGVDSFSRQVRDSEDFVMEAHRAGHFNATHLRYPIVYGPLHLGPPEWAIIRRVRDGRRRLILPGAGASLLSRGFSRNLVHAIMLAHDHPDTSAGQIYNICDDGLLSNRQWVGLLSQILGHEFELVDVPFNFLPKGFRATATQLLYPFHRVMDSSKIKSQLGYRDIVSVEQALEETVKWYTDHPLVPGGEEEQNLGDPYDYAYEDALMDIYAKRAGEIREAFAAEKGIPVKWRHPYPHPKKRGDLR